MTNGKTRITKEGDYHDLDHFKPSGNWRLLIVDDKKDLVLLDTKIEI